MFDYYEVTYLLKKNFVKTENSGHIKNVHRQHIPVTSVFPKYNNIEFIFN